jgi:hypothetical protein
MTHVSPAAPFMPSSWPSMKAPQTVQSNKANTMSGPPDSKNPAAPRSSIRPEISAVPKTKDKKN